MKQVPPNPNPMYVPGALIGTFEWYTRHGIVLFGGSAVTTAGAFRDVRDFSPDLSPGIVVASLKHTSGDPVILVVDSQAIGWIFVDLVWDDLYNAMTERV